MRIEHINPNSTLGLHTTNPEDTTELKLLACLLHNLMDCSMHPMVQMSSPGIGQFLQQLGSRTMSVYTKIQEERLVAYRLNRGPVAERLREAFRVNQLQKKLMEKPSEPERPAHQSDPEEFIYASTPKELEDYAKFKEETQDLIPGIEHGSNGTWNLFSLRSDKWDQAKELRQEIKHHFRDDKQGSYATGSISVSSRRVHHGYVSVSCSGAHVGLFNALENVTYEGSGRNLPAGIYRSAVVDWLATVGIDGNAIAEQKLSPEKWSEEFKDIAEGLRAILERENANKAKAIEETYERGYERCFNGVMYEVSPEMAKLWPVRHDTFEASHFKCWLQHPFDDPKEKPVLKYQITIHAEGNEYVVSGFESNYPRVSYKTDYDKSEIDRFNPGGGYYERKPTERAYHFLLQLMSVLLVARENASQTCHNKYLKWVESEILDRQERAARGEVPKADDRRA